MKRALAAVVTLFALTATSIAADAPQGWFLAGSRPQDYTVTVDPKTPKSGTSSALLESRPGREEEGFGTLMQTFGAAAYAGKRVRMTADVRAQAVQRWAGLWMRVDASGHRTLAFDNMQDRAISGNSEWRSYAVVLDVPAESESISFGVLLSGPGRVWIDNVRFEEVSASVPTTGKPAPIPGAPPAQPLNLDFESN